MKIRIPGVVWAILLVALTAFLQANFENAIWYQSATVVIVAILKALNVGYETSVEDLLKKPVILEGQRSTLSKDKDPSYFGRWLIG